MGHYDGHAHIAGHWQLMDADGATLLREPFQRRVALEEDGYDALVESLSSGWRANARELAPRIRTAMNSR
jgi:uncharacterized lipoprotein YmbA